MTGVELLVSPLQRAGCAVRRRGTLRLDCAATPRPELRGTVLASRTGSRCTGAHVYTNERVAVGPVGLRRYFAFYGLPQRGAAAPVVELSDAGRGVRKR